MRSHGVNSSGFVLTLFANSIWSNHFTSITSSGFGVTFGRFEQVEVNISTSSCSISPWPTSARYSIFPLFSKGRSVKCSSSNKRRLAQSTSVSFQYGWVQHVFAHNPGVWYLLRARLWSNILFSWNTKTDMALCFKPSLWASSFSTGWSAPSESSCLTWKYARV